MAQEYLNWKIDVTDGLEAADELELYNINCIAEDEAVYVSAINFYRSVQLLYQAHLTENYKIKHPKN